MKQIKFKQLATFGLCCSLLVNSLTGVTAVAETVTIESSPTAESTKENTEKSTKESTRETELQTSKTEEETSKVEVTKEETTSEKQETTETVEEGNSKATEEFNDLGSLLQPKQISPKAAKAVEQTATIPAVTYRFGFINEKGAMVSPNFFVMQTNLTTVMNAMPNQVGTARGLNNGNLKYLTIPSQVLTYTAGTNPAFSGATDFRLTVPRYYKMPTVRPGAYYTGSSATYPIATTRVRFTTSAVPDERLEVTGGQYALAGTSTAHSYRMNHRPWSTDSTTTYFSGVLSRANTDVSTGQSQPNYYTTDDTMYYFLENRRITENFVDSAGVKITPPTGFTQGKQTVIENTQYTFTQSGTLPDTYQANGKTYKFKGWYKGKTKPATLRTTKTRSYAMTYDDNDDLNVVYEVDTSKDYNFPSRAVSFQFLNEAGTIISPTPFTITTDLQQEINSTYTKLESITGTNSGNTKRVTIPAKTIRADVSLGGVNSYGTTNTRITIPKFYENISVYTGSAYTQATLNRYSTADNTLIGTPASNAPLYYGLNKMTATQFKMDEFDSTTTIPEQSKYLYNRLYVSGARDLFNSYVTPVGTIYYQLTNRKVTENFVDTNGVKITAPTGFTQGEKTVIDSDNFTYTSAKALPASYTADGKSYVLQGWYKGTEKPATLETSKTPSYSVTYNDQDDLTVVYKEGTISADLTMWGAVDVIDNGAPMEYWEVLLKNTGEVPLTSIKIKPTTDWASGISAPTELFILGTGQNTKARPITKEQWEAGFEIPLDNSLPVGGQLTINLIGTKVTGQPGQVLEAAVEVTGNFGNLKASDTVRIKDLDQEIKEPTGEGFISVPTFDFGQVGVASATKQHGLKKAADYYGNGTRNPYVRISKTQPNWSLTAQLSQPKSATDSLPTATRLLLGAAPVSSFSNYNQPTELKNAIGTTNAIHLTANNAATSIIANQQFTGSDVYQLDFTFDNIKLEVPANQGTAGQQYQAAVTWNLVTGP